MKNSLTQSHGAAQSPAVLFAALALAALVPAGCVLWFMSVAVRNERFAVQQRLADVYASQLASLQRQLDGLWRERAAALASTEPRPSAERFAAIVRSGSADAVVLADSSGKLVYPGGAAIVAPAETKADWAAAQVLEFQKKDFAGAAAAYTKIAESSDTIHTKARALLAEANTRLKAGDRSAALDRLSQVAGDATLRGALSPQGTLIAPNAQLLLLKILASAMGPAASADVDSDREREPIPGGREQPSPPMLYQATLDALVSRLNDYSDPGFSAAQRRFLMREVKSLAATGKWGRDAPVAPGGARAPRPHDPFQELFPTLAAEDLAADYVEAGAAPPTDTRLHRAPLTGVWRLASADRTAIALFREDRIKAALATSLAAAAPPGTSVRLLAPDEPFTGSKFVPPVPAGGSLPGWRLALTFTGDNPLAAASARETRFYLWTGSLVVTVIALLAWLVARTVNAQLRLARLKNELVSTVSHELKTPLASMRALVDTLSAGRYADNHQLHDYLRLIARENERLSRLIDNFLAFSRLERGHARFHFEPIEPPVLVEAASAALREKLGAADCHFETQLAPALPAVRGDSGALTTVLVNLLDNACKYTGAEKHIALFVYPAHGFVCFEVTDNGIGLPAGERARIFERFYQVDQSLTRQHGGCGLGLGIVQSIVHAHGGTVEVESEPGKGSTFQVKIPVAGTAHETHEIHESARTGSVPTR